MSDPVRPAQGSSRTGHGLPPTKITAHSTAVVCQDVQIVGDVTIGAGTVVHPKAKISALRGPIVIGENCIVEELAAIVNKSQDVLSIGVDNVFMVGCTVECQAIGDYNIFQPQCTVGSSVRISDHCNIGSRTTVGIASGVHRPSETLPPHTVVFGGTSERQMGDKGKTETEADLHDQQIKFLRDIIPKFNRVRVV